MSKNKKQNNNGFIALMSAIIISAVLMLIVINMSLTGFYSRTNILDSETKERSSALADACIDIALLGFAQNASYTGNINVTVGENSCFIGPVTTSGSQKIFKIKAIIANYYTNLNVIIDGTNFSIISTEETPTF